jgi:hypothetical protein
VAGSEIHPAHAADDDAGRVEGVFDPVLPFLHFNFRRAAGLDDGNGKQT